MDLANLVLEGAGDSDDPVKVAGWFKQAAASAISSLRSTLEFVLTRELALSAMTNKQAMVAPRC